jgi:uncharacterized protein YjbI with pentapeptide repeats
MASRTDVSRALNYGIAFLTLAAAIVLFFVVAATYPRTTGARRSNATINRLRADLAKNLPGPSDARAEAEPSELSSDNAVALIGDGTAHKKLNLRGVQLKGVVLDKPAQDFLDGANLRDCDLTGSKISGGTRTFYDADFSGAKLSNSVFAGEQGFQRARFDGADLANANWQSGVAGLSAVSFRNANLANAQLSGDVSSFQCSTFERAKITNAQLIGDAGAFQASSFEAADLTGATLSGVGGAFQIANFDNATLFNAKIICRQGGTAFQGALLNNTDFSGADLSTIDSRNLESCEFADATPPKYSATTKFPTGFSPSSAGWIKITD